jgi:U3 small nucleolar RNA-associated protein 12
MDFGDCNKSFAAAHEDSVMCVKFVPKTHYFFSCSKDKSIKYWDADRKIKIQNVEPIDQSELWTLCVFGTGNGIVAAGNSKAIRVFHETSDVVYVDEENEKELEKVFEEEAVRDADALLDAENKPGAIEGSYLSGPSEVGQAGKGTLENLKASERLVDYLDIIKQELSTNPQPNQISQNPLLMGKSVEEFIAYAISTIPTPDLQVSIILLPFDHALRLLEYTNILVERNMLIELCVRCQLYIIETHIQQLSSNDSYVDLLLKIRTNSRKRLSAHKDLLGLNLAAMKYIQQEISKPNKKIRLAPA